jgi:hypothetical protein
MAKVKEFFRKKRTRRCRLHAGHAYSPSAAERACSPLMRASLKAMKTTPKCHALVRSMSRGKRPNEHRPQSLRRMAPYPAYQRRLWWLVTEGTGRHPDRDILGSLAINENPPRFCEWNSIGVQDLNPRRWTGRRIGPAIGHKMKLVCHAPRHGTGDSAAIWLISARSSDNMAPLTSIPASIDHGKGLR